MSIHVYFKVLTSSTQFAAISIQILKMFVIFFQVTALYTGLYT